MGNTYEPTLEHFTKEAEAASMEVLLDNGLYRHLRVRFKNGGFGWFDIMTWPSNLTITGDCETFTFSRLEDMFAFFRSSSQQINPRYWQEKVVDGRDRCKTFDWDHFRSEALAIFDSAKDDVNDFELRAMARQNLEDELDEADPDEWGAVQLLREYQYTPDGFGSPAYFFFDLSDGAPDGKVWDYHYIWCCRAIAWAIHKYDEHHANNAPISLPQGATNARVTTDATTHPA